MLVRILLQARLQHHRIGQHVFEFAEQHQVPLGEASPPQQPQQRSTGLPTATRNGQDEGQVIVGHRVTRLGTNPLFELPGQPGQRPETVHPVTRSQHPREPFGLLGIWQFAQVCHAAIVVPLFDGQLAGQSQGPAVAGRPGDHAIGQVKCRFETSQSEVPSAPLHQLVIGFPIGPQPLPADRHHGHQDQWHGQP